MFGFEYYKPTRVIFGKVPKIGSENLFRNTVHRKF